ncbi:MAG: hypothetical protein PGN13_14215 [Patulibacter minatonensis]
MVDSVIMEVLPRLCCSGLDALMASPVPPRLVLSPIREQLTIVGERGEDLGALDWCPVCGRELGWSSRRPAAAASRAAPPSQAVPVAVVASASRFRIRAAGRAATGVVIGIGPQALTCLVALWLGEGRDPAAGDPDVLTLSPVWPLSTGAWDIDGLEPHLAGALRCRAVVERPHPTRFGCRSSFLVDAAMRLTPADALPAEPLFVHEPDGLLARAA